MVKRVTSNQITTFKDRVDTYYQMHGRHDLPWRQLQADGTLNPYYVLVSEIMLQQTQVKRVIEKFQVFTALFPTVQILATVPLAEVLQAWTGLGYNRRAKFLHQAAQMISQDFSGEVPSQLDQLIKLPGVGVNTAAAIRVYSFNKPVVFIETNIRTVFLHHFFPGRTEVADGELIPYIEAALDRKNPRRWYWALMDYGSHLKTKLENPSRRSKHYTRQTPFNGSKRQIRGAVLKLLQAQNLTEAELILVIKDPRLSLVLEELEKEQLISQSSGSFKLG